MSVVTDGWRNIDDVREELGVRLGERGDYVAVKTAEVGDAVLEGELPDRRDVEELREALDEIAATLATIEELDEATEGGAHPLREKPRK